MLDIIKSILFGIVEGITEWLPISSTGHMILLEELVKMDVTPQFWDMFLVVIQLGAIMAVVVLYFNKIFPFNITKKDREQGHGIMRKDVWILWLKILIATIPAVLLAPFDDQLDALFRNYVSVAIALIVFGIAFIVVENYCKGKNPKITQIADITYKTALVIGLFQMLAAIFPGTSRSGATIVGALLIGVSRTAIAEFTFYLAIPAMAGASLLKLLKFFSNGGGFSGNEAVILLIGTVVSFVVSIIVIRFFMNYIRKHNFKVFGWYRIILGLAVLAYFFFR